MEQAAEPARGRAGAPSVRPATPADVAAIGRIWDEGWHDAHVGNVPDALVAAREAESFDERAREMLAGTFVADVDGGAAGFVTIVGDEVEQVYVDRAHRGSGAAGLLLRHAEAVLRAAGHDSAWLAVAAGNERAQRFYVRQGWVDEGAFAYAAATRSGTVEVPCHRFTRRLDGGT